MQERLQVWIGVIVKDGDKILMWKRKWSHGAWYRWFLWWKLDYGETFFDCARREVLEEGNITLRNLKILWCTNNFFEEDKKHFVSIFVSWDILWWELKNCEPDKLEWWEWCDPDNLLEPILLPIQNLLKQWKKLSEII